MKKIYIKPETEEVKLRFENQLLAGSNENFTVSPGEEEEDLM